MATWNADFDISPKGSDLVGTMDDKIRETRQAVRERVAQEHLFDLSASSQQGLHKMGSARVWLSDTEPASPIPTAVTTETAGDEDKGRLWVVTSTGTPTGEVKVYSGSAWVSLPSSVASSMWTLLKAVSGFNDDVKAAALAGANFAADTWTLLKALGTFGSDIWTAAKAVSGFADDLLTAVKTVDGASSGLDADLLDGQHGSYYTPDTQYLPSTNVSSTGQVEVDAAVTATKDFRVKYPISAHLWSGSSGCTLSSKYRSSGASAPTAIVTSGSTVSVFVTLNPGTYTLSVTASIAKLCILGVFGKSTTTGVIEVL